MRASDVERRRNNWASIARAEFGPPSAYIAAARFVPSRAPSCTGNGAKAFVVSKLHDLVEISCLDHTTT
jgi:hypothetical protein